MSILIDKDTSMLIIGITGKQGRIHCKHILDTGSKLLAGVAPGRGGQEVEGVPVFETVAEAREKFPEIEAAMLIVPKQFVRDAALQAFNQWLSYYKDYGLSVTYDFSNRFRNGASQAPWLNSCFLACLKTAGHASRRSVHAAALSDLPRF